MDVSGCGILGFIWFSGVLVLVGVFGLGFGFWGVFFWFRWFLGCAAGYCGSLCLVVGSLWALVV